jgi:hypothetical protein
LIKPVPYARSSFTDEDEEFAILNKRLLLRLRRCRRSEGAVKNERRLNLFLGYEREMLM